MAKKGHCSNREIVNVAGRLYSPKYVSADNPGSRWYELWDGAAMCYFGMCDPDSYNDWVNATYEYINGKSESELYGRLKKAEAAIKSRFGGAAIPVSYAQKIANFKDFIKSWNESGHRANKSWTDWFSHPMRAYWKGQVREVSDWFDRAACKYDEVEELEYEITKDKSGVIGAPTMVADEDYDYFGKDEKKHQQPADNSAMKKAGGVILVGVGGYFAYKLLTE